MKFTLSFAVFANFIVSASAITRFKRCPGDSGATLFAFKDANFAGDTIDPTKEICLTIKGILKTELSQLTSNINYEIRKKNCDKDPITWSIGISSFKPPNGPDELKPCFYLPPEISRKANQGDGIGVTAEVLTKDKSEDLVRVFCVNGVVRVGNKQ